MLKFITNLLGGNKHEREIKSYRQQVAAANDFFAEYQSLSHDALRSKTTEFRQRIADHLAGIDEDIAQMHADADATEDINAKEDFFSEIDKAKKDRNAALEDILLDILPEAYAVVKETSRRFSENPTLTVTATQHDRHLAGRGKKYIQIDGDQATWQNNWMAAGGEITWNMVHYDVQLIGGMALHGGKIAEMGTGEGKTLVATLPAYLNGLSGQGVHIVTVNDYLARRDSEWVGPIFEFLFLTVDCIDKYRPNSNDRRQAYACDITYGTNNEFGFDYLRDNMVHSPEDMVQRPHHYAMVDEVDSVLIDDARTPLIISGPVAAGAEEQEYLALKPRVELLIDAQRRFVSEQLSLAKRLIADGNTSVEEDGGGLALFRAHRGLPKNRPTIKYLSEEGMRVLLQKTENHYMQENSKHMPDADAPLYFTIEEKTRNVELTDRGAELLAKGTGDVNFFILPDITHELMALQADETLAADEKAERKSQLSQEYSIKSQRLHGISQLLKAYTLFERDDEYVVIDGEVKIVDEQTGRMMEGRRYSDGLHQAIEAKENVKIGETTQTYATVTLQNYFRMYHKLAGMTGTAETEAQELWQIYKLEVTVIPTNRPVVRKDQEDLVFKTAREKYNAVIDDIEKRRAAGQPVLVGTTSVDISEKLSRMMQLRNIPHNVLNAKQHQREAEIVSEAGLPGNITIATNMAGRGTDIKLGPGVKEAGGLAIIGTERHDSRRVDRQLRGRSGRQGDPGASQFYVSLEDNLMRLFQSERIAGLMDKMGHKEGEMIQHSMVTKSIERAQKKVEENNYGVRKRLLEYDDVMNVQRENIYKKRFNALSGDRLQVDIYNMIQGTAESLVGEHHNSGDFEAFRMASITMLGVDPGFTEKDFRGNAADRVIHTFTEQLFDFYHDKGKHISEQLMPIILDIKAREGNRYKRISVPYTDGRTKMLPIAADMDDAIATGGKTIMRDIEKTLTLAVIDDEWKEHLRAMDDLKESVQGASFEQKDPLVIYKMEAYGLFEQLINRVNTQVTGYLLSGMLAVQQAPPQQTAAPRPPQQPRLTRSDEQPQLTESAKQMQRAAQNSNRPQGPQAPIRVENKIGPNEPCPCGSGKKYKKCHGQ